MQRPGEEVADQALRIVLLGPPGAGKGTQAVRIAARFAVPHIATGDIFRDNVDRGTPLGRVAKRYIEGGELVPDEIVIDIVSGRLAEPDCRHGFVLDGFPRSLPQARALGRRLDELGAPLDAAVSLELEEEELFKRLAARSRADDTEQTIRNRLRVFAATNGPLVRHYEDRGLLVRVDAAGDRDEVTERLVAMLEDLVLHPLAERLAERRRPVEVGPAPAMRMVMLGQPGAGKGTQAARIAAHFGIVHLATGDILRANVAEGTPLGRMAQEYVDSGELVPDELVVDIVLERLGQPDCRAGFVLDGYPRTIAQAKILDRRLGELDTPLTVVLNLEVPEEELFHRLRARSRPDDDEDILRTRLRVYRSATQPLLDYYDDQDLLVSVDGRGEPDTVSQRVLVALVQYALLGQAVSQHRRAG